MAKTIVVVGYGPGISHAVAEKFGAAGFSVAIVARNRGKLEEGKRRLESNGIRAIALGADASNELEVRKVIRDARTALGPIAVIHWNAAAPIAGDLLSSSVEELVTAFKTASSGLVAAVQESLPDLRQQAPESAVLATNGGFGLDVDKVDAIGVQTKNMGLAVGNAAKHKTMRLLAQRLANDKIHVGEVMVLGTVKGTAWDDGHAALEAPAIADRFWQLYQERKERFVQFG